MTHVKTTFAECAEGDPIAHVTIHRSEKSNALDSLVINDLIKAFQSLIGHNTLKLVVLTGEGNTSFIGGADINEMQSLTPEKARGFITNIHKACSAIRAVPVPVIAKINGYCLGAGLEIAAACDLRIASDNARFAMPEVQVGIPSVVEAALLPRLIGWGKTSRLLYTGESISAETAMQWGLLEELVRPELLEQSTDRICQKICTAGANAIRLQKQLISQWETGSLKESIEAGIDTFVEAYKTNEPEIKMAAFFNQKSNKNA